MSDVLGFSAKKYPPVPSVFECFKVETTTSLWKLGLCMSFPEWIV